MNSPQNESADAVRPASPSDSPAGRAARLAAWVIVVFILLLIPLKIMSFGFMPAGDARRHVARVYTDQPYSQIVVMRPEYKVDHSPGWEWLLRQLHAHAGLSLDQLMSFSIVGLLVCVLFAPLPWLKRPEAWLLALLAQLVALPELMTRLTQARPYLLTEAVLITVLFAWTKGGKEDAERPSPLKLALTAIGITLSVWIHGSWYLWVLPVFAFAAARWWRAAVWLGVCWVAGVIAGASLTGRPLEFLYGAIFMASRVSAEHVQQWQLAGEFVPSYGEFNTVAMIGLVLLWRRWQDKSAPGPFKDPVFCLIATCWILAFKADRFWADWGVAATLVWLTTQFEALLEMQFNPAPQTRVLACMLVALPLYLDATNDLDRRYTGSLDQTFLDAGDPSLQGWFPEDNGIFYTAHWNFFYDTFYKNPRGRWRYILGFEPALMPDEDLKIFRSIQYHHWALDAYEPWIRKMRPGDRLEVWSTSPPGLPELEWHYAAGGMWIGRLPRAPQHALGKS